MVSEGRSGPQQGSAPGNAVSMSPSPHHPLISVVIVNYNGGPFLLRSVGSALASTVPVDLCVVDNGSVDGSVQALRSTYGGDSRLRLIENGVNLGFARANNVALKRAGGDWLLLLNPDCVLQPDTLERMVAALMADPRAGMAGCVIRNPDGSEQAGCRRTIPTPWTGLLRALHLGRLLPSRRHLGQVDLLDNPLPDKPIYVEAISGAFMMVRRDALQQVGLLDEGYFLHCEDLDWCKAFQETGWQILFVPGVDVVHHKGACSTARPVLVLWHKHKGMVRFYRKFLSRRYAWPLNLLVVVGVWLRFLAMAPLEVIANGGRRGSVAAEARSLPPPPAPRLPLLPALAGRSMLVTGGTGFIGTRLVAELVRQGARVRVLSRSPERASRLWPNEQVGIFAGDLTHPESLAGACEGIEILFHLASCNHMLDEDTDGDGRHYQVTELGTSRLLVEAQHAGVGVLVFVSSVKAMGEGGEGCQDELSGSAPESAYGIAKRHAEQRVLAVGGQGAMRVTVLRLPMVYGPGNKGNLPRMIQAIRSGRFPPLPRVPNRRSMVHVDDTVQAMLLAAASPAAAGRVYIVTDNEAYSTADIDRLIRLELGQGLPHWILPLGLLRAAARVGDGLALLGVHVSLRGDTLRKLLGSAWYSSERIRRELGYRPRYNLQRALPEMVAELDTADTAAALDPSRGFSASPLRSP
jgi:GT2 family glycosyltransferase/nucleoside-diphosphate-sugar epimerase